jgi:hypothetical protein
MAQPRQTGCPVQADHAIVEGIEAPARRLAGKIPECVLRRMTGALRRESLRIFPSETGEHEEGRAHRGKIADDHAESLAWVPL